MSKKYRLFLDQMFRIDVAQKLREEGYDVSEHLKLEKTEQMMKRILTLLLPFLRVHSQDQFRDHLVILSEKRAKWIKTE
jgi:uncharacterized protein YebE (UPF0316 family)